MSRTLQFRRLGTATLANTIGANGELIINSTNKALTVHDGSTPGGFALLNQATDNNIDQTARDTANTAFDNTIVLAGVNDTQNNNITILQEVNITQNTDIETAISLSQGAYDNSNTKFSADGGQINGSVIVVGDLDVTNNTSVTNTMEANNVIIDGTLYTGLAARSSVVLPHLVAQFASNSASYIQVNSQNINPEGSADYVITADNGTDSDFFLDLGLKGSQSNDQLLRAYDGYLTVQGSTIGQAGGNLIIGTTSSYAGLETKFVAGGYNANNVVMKLGTYGANVVGNLTVTGTITSQGGFTSIDQVARDIANTASANTIVLASVNTTQNTNITTATNLAQSAFNTANNANTRTVINGLGVSKLDFATFGANTAYLTTTSDDTTALIMGTATAELYAYTSVQIRANTEGTAKVWTFNETGALTFPDSSVQNTAFTGTAIDQDARNSANAAAQTIPQNAQSTDYTLQLTDAGKHIYYTQASNTTLYIPTTSNVAFSNGSTIMIISATSAGANVTVSPNTGVTMYLAGNTTSVSRNVTTYGMATLIQVAANTWFINGTGVA
jgi:hypothetical protein